MYYIVRYEKNQKTSAVTSYFYKGFSKTTTGATSSSTTHFWAKWRKHRYENYFGHETREETIEFIEKELQHVNCVPCEKPVGDKRYWFIY